MTLGPRILMIQKKFKPYGVVRRSAFYRSGVKIIRVLQNAGFEAYFVGGAVRDLWGQPHILPKDLDIACSASPHEVSKIFATAQFVGENFGVSLVSQGGFCFELAMFRKEGDYQDGRHPSCISQASLYEDSCRRDFTINALYFDPVKKIIVDFHNGLSDLNHKIIRCVGDPKLRFKEDILRVLRALRFCVLKNFSIENTTKNEIIANWEKLHMLPKERIVLEWQKTFRMKKLVNLIFQIFLNPLSFLNFQAYEFKRKQISHLDIYKLPLIKSNQYPFFKFLFFYWCVLVFIIFRN